MPKTTTTTEILAKEKAYLVANQTELASRYPGKFLLIKEETVYGAFDTYEEGVVNGTKKFGAGPFLVRSVLHPGDSEVPVIPALSIGVPSVACP